MEAGSICGNFFILLSFPTTKAVDGSCINTTLLNNNEEEVLYFDKGRLENMGSEIIIEYNEDDDRHLIDMAQQLSQQSEANNRTKYNYKLPIQFDR